MVKTLLINGEFLTLEKAAEKYNLSVSALRSRIIRNPSVDPSELLYKTSEKNKKTKYYNFRGESKSIVEWGEVYPDLSPGMIRERLKNNVSLDLPKIKRGKSKGNWEKPMPVFHKDTQLKNTVKSYKKMGLSDREIYYKITNGDFFNGGYKK